MTAQRVQPVREIIVVLGMRGDGGPLVSGVLNSLGVDMADLTGRGDEASPLERPPLLQIYDELSALVDRPVSSPAHVLPLAPGWWRQKDVQALKLELAAYVRDELARSDNLWGFEDPRTPRFLPLWWEVFRELELQPIYIHAIRSPGPLGEGPRTGWSPGGELPWLSHNYDIVRHATAKESESVLVVDYDAWFQNGAALARDLASQLGLADSLPDEEYPEMVEALLGSEPQYNGEPGEPKLPQAGTLYHCLVSGRWMPGGDRRELRALVQQIETLFTSIQPTLLDLDAHVGHLEDENRRALRAVRETTDMLERVVHRLEISSDAAR